MRRADAQLHGIGGRSAAGLAPLWLAWTATLCVALPGCLAFHRGPMAGEPVGATFVTVDDGSGVVRVRVQDRGDVGRPVVVLLHGFASAIESWATVTPRLLRTHRVIALDLKGFGWTDRPPGDYSPKTQARLVVEVLRARGVVGAFDLIGHSWGSSVALAVALEAPDRVGKVVLYDAWVYDDQLPAFFRWARVGGVGEALFSLYYDQRADERLVRAFFDPAVVDEAFVEAVEEALRRPGTKAAALAAVRGQDFAAMQQSWPKVRQPVLLLWGRDDRVAWLSFGERLARDLPDARLKVFPRCGHFPMIEAAEASWAELAGFLGVAP